MKKIVVLQVIAIIVYIISNHWMYRSVTQLEGGGTNTNVVDVQLVNLPMWLPTVLFLVVLILLIKKTN